MDWPPPRPDPRSLFGACVACAASFFAHCALIIWKEVEELVFSVVTDLI